MRIMNAHLMAYHLSKEVEHLRCRREDQSASRVAEPEPEPNVLDRLRFLLFLAENRLLLKQLRYLVGQIFV